MRRTFLMIALAMAVLTADPASARKDRLVYYGDDPAGTVAYSLPSTTLTIDVEAIRENYYAGPYAQYAAKYLGIDVRTADEVSYTLSSVSLTPYAEADLSRRYLLNLRGEEAATAFLKEHNFELKEMIDADAFVKLSLLRIGADAVCEPIEIRKSYCTYITTLLKLWKFLDRDDITQEMKQSKDALEAIYKELQKKRKHADITNLSVAINAIVDEHLELDADSIVAESASNRRFDISKIDFDLLRREFAKKREKNLIMKDIQELLQERIVQMMAANPSRINFYEKYQEIIHNYNAEQNRASIEKTFEDLIHLTEELSEEEKRYIREGFENDEQLSLYDVLFKDDLSKEDIRKLKNVAKDLLGKIKSMLKTMDHPFDKQETKASIVIAIRDLLWQELPESYSDESITYYRDAVFNYISQRYGGVA